MQGVHQANACLSVARSHLKDQQRTRSTPKVKKIILTILGGKTLLRPNSQVRGKNIEGYRL